MGSRAILIPVRGGSAGVPKKNIRNFCGVPLLSRCIETCTGISPVCVITDDDELSTLALKSGATVERISRELASGMTEGAIIDVLKRPTFRRLERCAFVQVTQPAVTAADVATCLDVLSDYHCSLTVTKFHGFLWASAVDGKLEPRNIWSRDRLGGLVPKNHAGGIRLRRQEMTEQQYQEDGGVYAFQVPGFMETKSRTYGSIFPVVVPSWRRFEIDNEEDWQICEMLHTWSRK